MRDFNAFLRDKLLAGLLALGVYYLQTISQEIKEIGRTLAVAVAQVADHERRIENLERKDPSFGRK